MAKFSKPIYLTSHFQSAYRSRVNAAASISNMLRHVRRCQPATPEELYAIFSRWNGRTDGMPAEMPGIYHVVDRSGNVCVDCFVCVLEEEKERLVAKTCYLAPYLRVTDCLSLDSGIVGDSSDSSVTDAYERSVIEQAFRDAASAKCVRDLKWALALHRLYQRGFSIWMGEKSYIVRIKCCETGEMPLFSIEGKLRECPAAAVNFGKYHWGSGRTGSKVWGFADFGVSGPEEFVERYGVAGVKSGEVEAKTVA